MPSPACLTARLHSSVTAVTHPDVAADRCCGACTLEQHADIVTRTGAYLHTYAWWCLVPVITSDYPSVRLANQSLLHATPACSAVDKILRCSLVRFRYPLASFASISSRGRVAATALSCGTGHRCVHGAGRVQHKALWPSTVAMGIKVRNDQVQNISCHYPPAIGC